MIHTPIVGFEDGRHYGNVYFLFIDAKGHSTFVRSNDEENVFRVFDRLENEVARACNDAASRDSCALIERWGWMGDGGLMVFYDDKEGNARRAALRASFEILKSTNTMNDWIADDPRINGDIHLRLALHKGSLRYRAPTGSIHSTALNLAAHAEKSAPVDSLVVSDQVFRVCSEEDKKRLQALTPDLEGEKFYVGSLDSRPVGQLVDEWQTSVVRPSGGSAPFLSDIAPTRLGLNAVFSQRAATGEYAQRIELCQTEIAVLGIGLSGFVADHADVLQKKVDAGVRLRVLLPAPEVTVTVLGSQASIPAWRAAAGGLEAGLAADRGWSSGQQFFTSLAERATGHVELRYYRLLPSGAVLMIDDYVYFSPFLSGREGLKTFTLGLSGGLLRDQIRQHFEALWADAAPHP